MKNRVFILLFEFCFGITLNIVGVISISELFLFFYLFYFLLNHKLFLQYPVLKKITWLYFALLTSQIISEIVVQNTLNNALKGIAITVISYLHFILLFTYFIKDRKIILFAIAGMVIKTLIFRADVYSGDLETAMAGQASGFVKGYLSQIIIPILLIISFFVLKKKIIAIISIALGLTFVILGARNAGVTIVLTGIIAYFVLLGKNITRKQFFIILAVVGIVGYGLYVIYVNQVLTGKIIAGNNEQLLRVENPYNPINLLATGRSDAFIGWTAFIDEPLFGHGAWANDITGKYHRLYAFFNNENSISFNDRGLIPAHSILIGAGTYNGIFAFMFMFAILFFFVRIGLKAVDKKDSYLIIAIYSILFILWNSLFSPASLFRNVFPIYFAILLTLYIIYNTKIKNNAKPQARYLSLYSNPGK